MYVAFVISFIVMAVIAGSVAYAIGRKDGDKAGWQRCYKAWGEFDRRRADEERRIGAERAERATLDWKRRMDAQIAAQIGVPSPIPQYTRVVPQQKNAVTLPPMSAEEHAKLLALWNATLSNPIAGMEPEPEPKYTKKEILEMFKND